MVRNLSLRCACVLCVASLAAPFAGNAQPAIGPGASSGTYIDLSAFELKSDAEEHSILQQFSRLDANTDGHVTRNEARRDASLSGQFRALDRNRDGKLSPEEFATR